MHIMHITFLCIDCGEALGGVDKLSMLAPPLGEKIKSS
jgi:hypothetical protein